MPDSSTVRKVNKDKIRPIMRDGAEFSKQQIASITGLSVATCNTLLNEMEKSGEISGSKQRVNEVGRSTVVYHMNEDYEAYLCIQLKRLREAENPEHDGRLKMTMLSPTGKILKEKTVPVKLCQASIAEETCSMVKEQKNVHRILIAVPGMVHDGYVEDCIFEGLKDTDLKTGIVEAADTDCVVESNQSFIAYGQYEKVKNEDGSKGASVISVLDFSKKELPICTTVFNGQIMNGSHGFAGRAGYLPFGASGESQKIFYKSTTFMPFAIKVTQAVIAMFNPSHIIFTGNLMEEKKLGPMKKLCQDTIPEKFFPELEILKDEEEACIQGMFVRVQRLKEIENAME